MLEYKGGDLRDGIAHNVEQGNDVRSTRKILKNLDLALDLLLLDGLEDLDHSRGIGDDVDGLEDLHRAR